jgi:hypothetical protein
VTSDYAGRRLLRGVRVQPHRLAPLGAGKGLKAVRADFYVRSLAPHQLVLRTLTEFDGKRMADNDRAKPRRTTWVTPIFPSRLMSTILSTLLPLIVRKPTHTLLTRPLRECQPISAYTNSAHRAQADELTLNQQVPGSSPGRRTVYISWLSGFSVALAVSEQRTTGLNIARPSPVAPSIRTSSRTPGQYPLLRQATPAKNEGTTIRPIWRPRAIAQRVATRLLTSLSGLLVGQPPVQIALC